MPQYVGDQSRIFGKEVVGDCAPYKVSKINITKLFTNWHSKGGDSISEEWICAATTRHWGHSPWSWDTPQLEQSLVFCTWSTFSVAPQLWCWKLKSIFSWEKSRTKSKKEREKKQFLVRRYIFQKYERREMWLWYQKY